MTSRLLVAALCSSCLTAQGQGSRVAFAQSYLQPDIPLATGYDQARGEGVFWGSMGVDSSVAWGAVTWIWDGLRWRPRYAKSYPKPGEGQAMAWDPVGSCLVLFGGYDHIARSYLGDTWRWDGKDWSRLLAPGPAPRWCHGMATDPIRRRVVLFGGADRVQYFTDTWEWDGRTWTQMTPPQVPIGRLFPFFCWNPKTQRVALLGGEFFGAYVVLLPCTEWDGSNWIPIAGAMQGGPLPALVRGVSFPDPDAGGVRIVGTATSLGGNPVSGPVHYLWDGQRLIRKNVSGVTPTSAAGSPFFDVKKQEVISFGGRSGRVRDTAAFDPRSGIWSERVRVDGSDWNLTFMSRPCLVPWIDAYIEFSASGTWLRTDAGYVRVGPLPAVQGSFMQATPFADPNQRVVYAYSPPGALMWRLTPWGVWNLLTTGMPAGCVYVGFDPLDGRHVFFDPSLARFIKWSEAGIQVLCNQPSLTGSGNREVRGAVDPARRRLVVSVKWPAAGRQDLFEWDGATWQSLVHPNGARPGTLQYVSWLGVVLQTGRELWSWDGQAWSLVSAELPIEGDALHDDRARRRLRIISPEAAHFFETVWDVYPNDLEVTNEEPVPGDSVTLRVASLAHAGQPWLLGLSTSIYPGIPLVGLQPERDRVLPLTSDPLLTASLGLGIRGVLDAQGRGSTSVTVPSDPSFLGFQCHACAISIAGNAQLGLVSRPVEIHVRSW